MDHTQDISIWSEEETWREILEPILSQDAQLADTFSRLWYQLLEYAQSGELGMKHSSNVLQMALTVTFHFTEVYKASRELYEMSLSGNLTPGDEPLHVLSEAIDRAKAKIAPYASEPDS